jgi:Flp pilus assembly protein protease CpaA
MDFLFIVSFVIIVIATLQDIKRREVDNWLNILLILITVSYFFFSRSVFEILLLGFLFLFMNLLSNLFYYSKVFAGGDAKLLFSLTAIFISNSILSTLYNIGIFVLLLMISGSLYGLSYSLVLYSKNYKKVNKKMIKGSKNLWFRYALFTGLILFVLSYVNVWFLFPAILIFGFPILYFFAKSLEEVSMVKVVRGNTLREGDWLLSRVKIKDKIIEPNWEGLSKEEVKLLKNVKKVKIKEGIPFVPAFLIAFLAYYFFKERIILFFIGII